MQKRLGNVGFILANMYTDDTEGERMGMRSGGSCHIIVVLCCILSCFAFYLLKKITFSLKGRDSVLYSSRIRDILVREGCRDQPVQ